MSPEPGDHIVADSTLDQLLKRLASWKKTVREQAVRDACALPPESLLMFIRMCQRESKRRNGFVA